MFNIIFVISKIYLLLFVFCFTADSCEIDQFPKPTQIKGYYHNLIYLVTYPLPKSGDIILF